jgi:nicotinamidase-related amidase
VWPEHCLIGTPGHNVVPSIDAALQDWAGEHLDVINYIFKGSNPLTEMYSGLSADVPIHNDPSTHLNQRLVKR